MPKSFGKGRCRNCRRFFDRQYETQVYCSVKCRGDYHNNGKTPQEQMLNRLKRFMKKPEFQKLMRETMRKEFQALAMALREELADAGLIQRRKSVSKSSPGFPADASSTNV